MALLLIPTVDSMTSLMSISEARRNSLPLSASLIFSPTRIVTTSYRFLSTIRMRNTGCSEAGVESVMFYISHEYSILILNL